MLILTPEHQFSKIKRSAISSAIERLVPDPFRSGTRFIEEWRSAILRLESLESPTGIDPTRLLAYSEETGNLLIDLVAKATRLGNALRPQTAAQLAKLVRIINTHYFNRIVGHSALPQEIEAALANRPADDFKRRCVRTEAAAHVRIRAEIESDFLHNIPCEPASSAYVQRLHAKCYPDASDKSLLYNGPTEFKIKPGSWRLDSPHNIAVRPHGPPPKGAVDEYMRYFEVQYAFDCLGQGARILAIAAAHHRLTYIQPFPNGNGKVARLMSHAMAYAAGVGANGLWSISRGLACGSGDSGEYERILFATDQPRRNDLDGQGNLSLEALEGFKHWFLHVCINQVTFMSKLFAFSNLSPRLA